MIEKIKKVWKGEVKDQKLFGINCIAMEFIFMGLIELVTAIYLKYTKISYTIPDRNELYGFLFSLTLPIQVFMFVAVVRVMKKQKIKYVGNSKRRVTLETLKTSGAVTSAAFLIPTFYITNSFYE